LNIINQLKVNRMKPIHLFLAFALLIAAGCKDDSDTEGDSLVRIDPSQHILGRWQEIARGNDMFPELEPDGHIIEFLPDGTYNTIWNSGTVTTRRYRIDAEFVYLNSGTGPDGHTDRYTFSGTDTLRLDYVAGAITTASDTPHFNIYIRLTTQEK
jgi:hypothetical protein